MYLIKVSKRYGNLFVLQIIKKDNFEEVVIFPQGRIPLVFKTDCSARMIARKHLSIKESARVSLVVGGCFVCSSDKLVIDLIVKYWKKQGVKLSLIEVFDGSEEKKRTNTSELEASVLNDIFNQCIQIK